MAKVAETSIYGLKCDVPMCGWNNMEIRREDYPLWRNAPCPWCGANVLTDADWNALLTLEKSVAWVEKWFGWLRYFNFGSPWRRYRGSSDGTGRITFKRVKE